MKLSQKQSIEHLYRHLAECLSKIAADKYLVDMPEIDLLVAVILQAARDRDEEYFAGRVFIRHCELLQIKSYIVCALIYKTWKYEDQNIVWTMPVSEEDLYEEF